MPRAHCLRVARRAAALAMAASVAACASATEPEVVEPDFQNVHIGFDSITVIGSCDHNSFFEDPGDGEFRFAMTVSDGKTNKVDLTRTLIVTLEESRSYALPANWWTAVRKDLSSRPVIQLQFWATETDGILGADPDMSNRHRSVTHELSGTTWMGSRSIALVKSVDCGVAIRYSITSTPVD